MLSKHPQQMLPTACLVVNLMLKFHQVQGFLLTVLKDTTTEAWGSSDELVAEAFATYTSNA